MKTPLFYEQSGTREHRALCSLYIHARLCVRSNVGDLHYSVSENLKNLALLMVEEDESIFLYKGRWVFVPKRELIHVTKDLRAAPQIEYASSIFATCASHSRTTLWQVASSGKHNPLSSKEFAWLYSEIGGEGWATEVNMRA